MLTPLFIYTNNRDMATLKTVLPIKLDKKGIKNCFIVQYKDLHF